MAADIDRLSKQYIRQQLYLAVGLFLITLLVMQIWFADVLLAPAIVSVVFALLLAGTIGLIWCRVAKGSPESLPTFFTAVSGFRLLLALAVMLVYYLIEGRESMLVFFLVFAVFYIASLTHHSIFFARVSNHS
ncbi:MAG: hypothetical protein IJ804_03825 [Prevotella sp.]|nr:hypothetical protein [Prevotella sp.]